MGKGKPYFIGLDNGGTSVKAGVYDLQGNEIAIARVYVEQIAPKDGWIERDIDQVWEANCSVMKKAVAVSGIDPREIQGIAITGYGNGAFFLKEDLSSAYKNNCILSGDMRAKEYVKNYISNGTIDKIIDKTNQSLWAGQMTPLIAWMQDHFPETMAETKYIMSCVDYLRAKLTGVPERVPVMGGLFDVTSCALACGLIDTSALCVVLGTWSINEFLIRKPIADKNFFMTTLYSIQDYYLALEGSTTSASNLQWFVDRFMQEEKRKMEEAGKDVYEECERMIASVPYDDSTIVFMPFLYGTNVNLDAKSCFMGINGRHTKAHMLRAVYEGIVFSHMYHIEKLYKYKENEISVIRIAGGGSGSDQWIQMFADALQKPVEVPCAKELGALGAAVCAMIGSGYYNSFEEAQEHYMRIRKVYQPNPERAEYYQKKYELYKSLLLTMDPVWKEWEPLEKDKRTA